MLAISTMQNSQWVSEWVFVCMYVCVSMWVLYIPPHGTSLLCTCWGITSLQWKYSNAYRSVSHCIIKSSTTPCMRTTCIYGIRDCHVQISITNKHLNLCRIICLGNGKIFAVYVSLAKRKLTTQEGEKKKKLSIPINRAITKKGKIRNLIWLTVCRK